VNFKEALDTVLKHAVLMDSVSSTLLDALGQVTAEEILAPFDLPFFDNTAMDGYAVRIADCSQCSPLPIRGYIPAGGVATEALAPGSAVKIMTGAPIPAGCEAIVPLEDAEEADQAILIKQPVRSGQHIRRAGEDLKRGDVVLPAGSRIRVPEVCLLSSLGLTTVRVYRKPVVAILATGDELVEPGQPLPPHRIYDSNSAALAAAVLDAGATPRILGIATDNRESLRQKIAEGLQADVFLTAAGVSVGDRDLVREVLTEAGVKQVFWKIKVKPGKATAFGLYGEKPVFSLPGNPVSAMIVFEELVRPALLKKMGVRQPVAPFLTATLQEDLRKKPGRAFFARVRLRVAKGKLLAWSAGPQDTGFQKTMHLADGLAVLPEELSVCHAGEEVKVHLLAHARDLLEKGAAER
jgi:molybdopterin molybdotransferase